MKGTKFKVTLFVIISLIVISILISNIGQNFKGNISSYDYTTKYANNLRKLSLKSRTYQHYVNFSAGYISRFMRSNNYDAYKDGTYMEEWKVYVPATKYISTLEVVKNNRVYKSYNYGTDFFEDFRGNITTGIVKSKATYQENLDSIHDVLKEILLYDGYKPSTTPGAISYSDEKLRSLGASGIISPCYSNNFLQESGYNNEFTKEPKKLKGIAKLMTTKAVFLELKYYANKGYTIKMQSGGTIKPLVYKNVYGIIKGVHPKYKPLVITTFYDGNYNVLNKKFYLSKNYQLSSAIIMDCMRVVIKQRLRKPDRTIVFAFLSGYSKNKEGINHFLNKNIDSNILLFDGLGLSDRYNITYTKNLNALSIDASNLLKTNSFDVGFRKRDDSLKHNIVTLTANNINNLKEIYSPNYYRVSNSSKFILSIIQEECFNINLITGNIRHFKLFEKYVRNNSALLSVIAIILLAIALFVPTNKLKKK